MSELKRCPIPLCGGEAEHTEGPDGESAVCCTTRGCLLTAWALSEDIWQALPRSIDVTAVATGLRLYVSLPGQPPSVKLLREWLDELEGRHG